MFLINRKEQKRALRSIAVETVIWSTKDRLKAIYIANGCPRFHFRLFIYSNNSNFSKELYQGSKIHLYAITGPFRFSEGDKIAS